jgi:hypothetical protein
MHHAGWLKYMPQVPKEALHVTSACLARLGGTSKSARDGQEIRFPRQRPEVILGLGSILGVMKNTFSLVRNVWPISLIRIHSTASGNIKSLQIIRGGASMEGWTSVKEMSEAKKRFVCGEAHVPWARWGKRDVLIGLNPESSKYRTPS